jgi:hypothetical protein
LSQLSLSNYDKGKVASLIKHYAMKTWGSGGIAPSFLTLTLDGGEEKKETKCSFHVNISPLK